MSQRQQQQQQQQPRTFLNALPAQEVAEEMLETEQGPGGFVFASPKLVRAMLEEGGLPRVAEILAAMGVFDRFGRVTDLEGASLWLQALAMGLAWGWTGCSRANPDILPALVALRGSALGPLAFGDDLLPRLLDIAIKGQHVHLLDFVLETAALTPNYDEFIEPLLEQIPVSLAAFEEGNKARVRNGERSKVLKQKVVELLEAFEERAEEE